jgi:hypothetical protein
MHDASSRVQHACMHGLLVLQMSVAAMMNGLTDAEAPIAAANLN